MLSSSRVALRSLARRAFATDAAAATPTKVTLNLNTPYESFFSNAQVDLVQIPGLVGEYGVTAGHTPIISQLKPGVIKVHLEREKDVQSFFTPGGFALTHANSVTDIACVELVKIEDIDAAATEASLNRYKAALATAAEGSPEKLDAQIGVDTLQAMLSALSSN
ncbi:Atp synthase subunit delta', partial [Globisporangium splendens]